MTAAVHASIRSQPTSYGSALIAIHWITVIAFVVVFAAIEFRGDFPRGSATRDFLTSTHKTGGLLILLLVLVRLVIANRNTRPPIVPAPPAWQQWLSRLVHLTLYAAMIAMPLLGWAMTSAADRPIPFFGLSLPPILSPDKELAHQLEEIHEFFGNALYFVIGLHAAAALFHHYVMKDNTLLRMVRPSR
ncbi:MAG: cytochrome b [Hyphomicrobium sp.]|uniref:cytochrome b n=1 Tax=Hyphomicrobium sp. TaxID=82 RepID=UPI0039E64D30